MSKQQPVSLRVKTVKLKYLLLKANTYQIIIVQVLVLQYYIDTIVLVVGCSLFS